MKNLLPLFLSLAIFLVACGPQADPSRSDLAESPVEKLTGDVEDAFYPDPKVPFMQDWQKLDSTTDYVVFPLLLGTRDPDGTGLSSYSKRSAPAQVWWNLLFYHPQNEEEHLLTDKKLLIDSWRLLSGLNAGHPARNYIFYNLRDEDTNGNGELDPADATKLAVSDKEGRSLVNLTPESYDLIGWNLVGDSGLVLAQIRPDANKDGKFDGNDPSVSYRIDLNNPTEGKMTFSPDRLREIEKLRDEKFPPKKDDE